MNTILFETGAGCVIAAAIGGGLKAFGIEIPILQSPKRQVLLGVLGAVLVGGSFLASSEPSGGPSSPPSPNRQRPDTESASLNGVEGTWSYTVSQPGYDKLRGPRISFEHNGRRDLQVGDHHDETRFQSLVHRTKEAHITHCVRGRHLRAFRFVTRSDQYRGRARGKSLQGSDPRSQVPRDG